MKRLINFLLVLIVFIGVMACQKIHESPAQSVHRILQWSTNTLENFVRKKGHKRQRWNFASQLSDARALLIFPAIVKAGFLVGAEAGTGILIARDKSGRWGLPAFYSLGAASFGLQLGLQDVETILLIRNSDALKAIIKDQGKFGADLGITLGFYGSGVEASTTSNLEADIIAYTNSKIGIFAGASLEGSIIARRRDLNESLYGKGAVPEDIISKDLYKTNKANKLRSVLEQL